MFEWLKEWLRDEPQETISFNLDEFNREIESSPELKAEYQRLVAAMPPDTEGFDNDIPY